VSDEVFTVKIERQVTVRIPPLALPAATVAHSIDAGQLVRDMDADDRLALAQALVEWADAHPEDVRAERMIFQVDEVFDASDLPGARA
jgi:hypothetical protein